MAERIKLEKLKNDVVKNFEELANNLRYEFKSNNK
jgi:hypothetical protein